ncbi:MAG: isopeptide-forming domain-containing fimbrial protein [Bacilli bacterium]|nr:isopeptide-forming domain-containing fimbrial protein [Bacilli bacterium]
MKKTFGLFVTTILSGFLLIGNVNATAFDDMKNRNTGSKNLISDSSVVVDKTIPSDYTFEFGAGNTVNDTSNTLATTYSGTRQVISDTDITTWANNWTMAAMNDGNATEAINSIKNSYSALYKNVGVYNNKIIDVRATVIDFLLDTDSSTYTAGYKAAITHNKTVIGNSIVGVRWVKIRYDFLDQNGNAVKVKGHTTYWDVDNAQGIVIEDNNKGIYTTNDNILKMSSVSSKPYIFHNGTENAATTDTKYAFTEIFEGTSITRTFQYGNPTNLTSWCVGGMLLSPKAVVPTDLNGPVKSVDKTKVGLGEEFTYTIEQEIPQKIQKNYYNSFSITDTLEPCLNVSENDISIKNEKETNVTDKFNISVSGQKITITYKNLNSAEFYGHTYKIYIKTSLKKDYDLSKYKKDDVYVVPNHATVSKDGNSKDTNEVTVVYEKEKTPGQTPKQDEPQIVYVPSTSAFVPLYMAAFGVVIIVAGLGILFYINKQKKNN